MYIPKAIDLGKLDKRAYAYIRSYVWRIYGLRLRYVCKASVCYYVLKANTSKRFKVNGACNILAKPIRVNDLLFWSKHYTKKGK